MPTFLDNELLGSVARGLPDPVMVLDDEGRYLAVIGGLERSRYDSMAFLVGRSVHEVLPEALAARFLADIREVLASGRVHVSEYALRADEVRGCPGDGPGGLQWYQGRIAPLDRLGPHGQRCVAWVIVNITERKRLEAELEWLAQHDELTGLRNRRSFLQCADQAMAAREGLPLQLAMVDLDHFKALNDTFGHALGDAVLRHVAALLHQELGLQAEVCRLGGEEFAVLFREHGLASAVAALERVRMRLAAEPLCQAEAVLAVDFSAGVCERLSDDATPYDLLQRADQLLYEAKRVGRGCVAYPGWRGRT